MAQPITEILSQIQAERRIDDDLVLALRQVFYADAAIGQDEAEALVMIDEALAEPSAAFSDLYIDALLDYVVHQQTPAGFVDQAKADWLKARILRDGRIHRPTELELVVRVLETAERAPASLSAFALAAVKASALARPGGPQAEDVDRLRRIVYAIAGDGDVKVSRPEAEAVFELNAALRGKAQPAGWRDFFVKAIADALMAAHDPDLPTIAAEQHLEAPIPPLATRLEHDFLQMGEEIAHGLPHAREPLITRDQAYADEAAADASAQAAEEAVTPEKARWLVEHIAQGGGVDDNEAALISYLNALSPAWGQTLLSLTGKAA